MGEAFVKKLKSRKLILSILAALMPVLCQILVPEMPTEKIVVSVVGLLGGVWGLAKEDVEKLRQGVHQDYQKAEEESAPASDAKG